MAVTPPVCDFGWKAPDFKLPGTDGRDWSLADVAGLKGTLIMFICNHCPYVQSVIDRIVRNAAALQAIGIGVAAISSNDVTAYPEDSFDNMVREAARHKFTFPYLFDENKRLQRLTERFAHRISLGLITGWGCSIADAWMRRGDRPYRMRAGIFTRPCARLPKRARVRLIRSRQWAVPSSGKTRDHAPCHHLRSGRNADRQCA